MNGPLDQQGEGIPVRASREALLFLGYIFWYVPISSTFLNHLGWNNKSELGRDLFYTMPPSEPQPAQSL